MKEKNQEESYSNASKSCWDEVVGGLKSTEKKNFGRCGGIRSKGGTERGCKLRMVVTNRPPNGSKPSRKGGGDQRGLCAKAPRQYKKRGVTGGAGQRDRSVRLVGGKLLTGEKRRGRLHGEHKSVQGRGGRGGLPVDYGGRSIEMEGNRKADRKRSPALAGESMGPQKIKSRNGTLRKCQKEKAQFSKNKKGGK